jgi:hypothetical protein
MYGLWVAQNVFSIFWFMVLCESNRLLPIVVEEFAVSIVTSWVIMDVAVPVKTETVSLKSPGLVHCVVH